MFDDLQGFFKKDHTLSITTYTYEAWKQNSLFDRIAGMSYGQSFCKYFGIKDYFLMYNVVTNADEYIKKEYVC